MYKVYYNERMLQFVCNGDSFESCDLVLRLYGNESKEKLSSMINAFEDNIILNKLIFICENIDVTWKTFCSFFLRIDAAGGVVLNPEQLLLMIFRNGKWDLPKGKIEKGEDPEKAAIREIFEECGISRLELLKQLPTSYHTYEFKGEKVLKRTFWYLMKSNDLSIPIPQLEEGITEVKWLNKHQIAEALKNTYSSIENLLNEKEINQVHRLLE